MNMNPKEYSEYVKKMGPKSPIWKDCFNAFWTGGLICLLGQLIQNGYVYVQKRCDPQVALNFSAFSLAFCMEVVYNKKDKGK